MIGEILGIDLTFVAAALAEYRVGPGTGKLIDFYDSLLENRKVLAL